MHQLNDTKVSINSTISAALWLVGAGLIVVSFFARVELAAIGLFLAGAGGVMSIRGFMCELATREQNAFELGRDYERMQQSAVTNVRSLT